MKELKLVERAQAEHSLNFTAAKQLVVNSNIVPEAPGATLYGGDADVVTTGACQDDIERLCPKVEPGEGRLAACLTARLRAQAAGNADEDEQVSAGCRDELAAFKADRATNINKDLALAFACRRDIRRHCRPKKVGEDPDAIMRCLRKKRKKLSDRCAEQVFAEEEDAAVDFKLDASLNKACSRDAELVCADVDPTEEGATLECLIDNRAQVSLGCQEELEGWEVDRADDVRLDRHLYRACAADMAAFCSDVEPGEARMEECLQDRREEEGFSQRCRQAVEQRMEREAADYRLNYGLREWCADDIDALCLEQKEAIELAEGYGADSQVISCLETQRERIRSPRCRQEVHRQMAHEAEDLRFDHELAKACHGDTKVLCSGVVPGSARVIHCLQDSRPKLSQQCSAQLLEHEIRLAEDVDFHYPLRRACVVEIQLLCANVPHGHAHVIKCLQDNLGDEEMSVECAQEVKRGQLASSADFRLNYRLRSACAADVASLCKDAAKRCAGRGCQGVVLDCLKDRIDELRVEECRSEVFSVIRLEAGDYRNDAQAAVVCAQDVLKLCPDVEPGEGRVHACLQRSMGKLSPACRAREQRLQILQARDVRLQPVLAAACATEMAVLCADVEPGKGRMQQCLVRGMEKPGFGFACRHELSVQMWAAQSDYRLDYGLSSACQVDAAALCKAEQAPRKVLACLVNRYTLVKEPCQGELSRFVRTSLWNYRQGRALTGVCDADVQALCPVAARRQKRGRLRAGMVGKCLAKQVTQGKSLAEGCRQLVLVAAPRDVRGMFSSGMSVEAVAAKVAQIAHSAGLSAAFVDQKARGMQAITVTGWVAFACVAALVAVTLGMMTFAAWRWACGGRQQQRYSRVEPTEGYKQGDV